MEKTLAYPKQSNSDLASTETYQTRLSSATDDEAWDSFLRESEAGDLLQSSKWAQLKHKTGWQVSRVVVERDGRIVAGAQLLLRPLPFPLGKIAYVPRGPVLVANEPELAQLVLAKLQALARAQRLQMLILQPPQEYEALAKRLPATHFQPTRVKIAPRSTLRIDLRPSDDEILGQMRPSTRANARRSSRKNMVVRQGSEADLGIFMRLHAASSERQGFSTASEEYYAHMWHLFASSGQGVLLISEYEGEPISAMLAVGFGKVVWAKRFGWSGAQRKRYPNEGLLWATMKWAKAQGYHWFDQDGVKWDAAEALANNQPIPESAKKSASYFKLGFGGQPVLFPKAQVYLYNPLLRFGYTSLFPRLARWSLTKKMITRMRLG
ncbi:MAG: peptidoglycan bridge formation protein FemAB [Ardenticatenaceae bacterium]|nr:MAG: peptidoglycan bridge formation protein FemAB [Ardenticatenaceae bacterium]